METDWSAEVGGGCDDDDDDIARFEAQCAARARAEGIGDVGDEGSDEDDDVPSRRARLVQSTGAPPQDAGEWRLKCELLQEKLAKREAELSQARGDIDLLRNDGTGPGDVSTEIKQRLLELTKKNRRMQVTMEGQKSKIQQLEAETKKPRAEARALAEEMAAQATNAMVGDGFEDWKKKYLQSSNKLQEVRQEVQELRVQSQRQKKVLLKELGSDEALDKALSTADDPEAKGWKGRAAQISQLQRQVRDMKEQLKRSVPKDEPSEQGLQADGVDVSEKTHRLRGHADKATEKEKSSVGHAAGKRREEFERLQEEVEKLRSDQAEKKQKQDALKSRAGVLESQLREMKAHVQTLLSKSDNDDQLVAAFQRQLDRHGGPSPEHLKRISSAGGSESGEAAELRQQNAELQEQVDRQAQLVLQLRQKNFGVSLGKWFGKTWSRKR